ncbi:MAG: mismatch-specific DNA-glycosylase [Nitrospiraceae bacterium]
MRTRNSLPDHIQPDVRVLFVGINPGRRSAAVGHHFAGTSNRFWKLLSESKLAPVSLSYEDDARLPEWGFGITNLISRPSRGIDELTQAEYDAGRRKLLAKVHRYQPRIVVLLGITLFHVLFPKKPTRRSHKKSAQTSQRLGLQSGSLGAARVFVLPNPSGRNAHYSYAAMLDIFRSLRRFIEPAIERMPP